MDVAFSNRGQDVKYTKLGKSDLTVSRICLGCMGFGNPGRGQHSWTVDEDKSAEIVRAALEGGLNFFDTAIGYQGGTSEQYLGKALAKYAKRSEVVIATKFLPRTPDEIEAGVTGEEHIRNSLDKSLENLGTDYVDLYIYHMWDWNTPVEDILTAMNQAILDGKVRALGISNCYAWQLAKANAIADENHLHGFVSVQNHYNLLFREEEREMAVLCREDQIAMTPYSALASGRLSRKPGTTTKRMEEDSYAKHKYAATADEDHVIIERVEEVAERMGVSMTDVALAWLLTKVTAPVVGATRVEQVRNALKAPDILLSQEDVAYLEEAYQPHRLVGVMADNSPKQSEQGLVWPTEAPQGIMA